LKFRHDTSIKFLKIGITTRSIKERHQSKKYNDFSYEILYGHKNSMLKCAQSEKKNNDIEFDGKTDTFHLTKPNQTEYNHKHNRGLHSMKIKSIKANTDLKHTWDIEVEDVHEYQLSNSCISHNTSGKAINSTESIEPIPNYMYHEEGTFTVPTVVANFKKNNKYYKTAFECDQKRLLENAAIRQKWIDQSQSVNTYISTPDSLLEMTQLNLYYFSLGGKTLYYQKSQKSDSEHVCESCT